MVNFLLFVFGFFVCKFYLLEILQVNVFVLVELVIFQGLWYWRIFVIVGDLQVIVVWYLGEEWMVCLFCCFGCEWGILVDFVILVDVNLFWFFEQFLVSVVGVVLVCLVLILMFKCYDLFIKVVVKLFDDVLMVIQYNRDLL